MSLLTFHGLVLTRVSCIMDSIISERHVAQFSRIRNALRQNTVKNAHSAMTTHKFVKRFTEYVDKRLSGTSTCDSGNFENLREELVENCCCRCIRKAHEHNVGDCDAIFDQNGNMLRKCSHCAGLRADCESVSKQTDTIHVDNVRDSLADLSI